MSAEEFRPLFDAAARRRLGMSGEEFIAKYDAGEIVAATVLCGELSLGSAIAAEECVTAHDQYGRNRP